MTEDDMIERFRMYSERFKQASLAGEFYLDTLQHNIIRLRKERDDARRMYCEHMSNISRQQDCTPKWFAEEMGWDCYKEDFDDR